MIRVHENNTSGRVWYRGEGPLVLNKETLESPTGDAIAYYDESIEMWVGMKLNQISETLYILD